MQSAKVSRSTRQKAGHAGSLGGARAGSRRGAFGRAWHSAHPDRGAILIKIVA